MRKPRKTIPSFGCMASGWAAGRAVGRVAVGGTVAKPRKTIPPFGGMVAGWAAGMAVGRVAVGGRVAKTM